LRVFMNKEISHSSNAADISFDCSNINPSQDTLTS
jgi:hypothetical protein